MKRSHQTIFKANGGQANLEGKKVGNLEGKPFTLNSLSSYPPIFQSVPLSSFLPQRGERTKHPSLCSSPMGEEQLLRFGLYMIDAIYSKIFSLYLLSTALNGNTIPPNCFSIFFITFKVFDFGT